MKFFHLLFDLLRHLGEDAKWRAMIDYVGHPTLYVVMFMIIFCETGLVILPFLPGDSLLFAIGALGARPGIGINLPLMAFLLIVAAVIGDAVNYAIGKRLGPKVFSKEENLADGVDSGDPDAPKKKPPLSTRLLNKKHLEEAQRFYEKHGGKTIILARFVPIVRTFAPFVAGIGKMSYLQFAAYNVIGAIAWVCICIGAGRLFGEMEIVKKNFELVIIAIVVISVLPVVFEMWKAKRNARRGFDPIVEATTLGEKVD